MQSLLPSRQNIVCHTDSTYNHHLLSTVWSFLLLSSKFHGKDVPLFICWLVKWHLGGFLFWGGFQSLAIITRGVINICVEVSAWTWVFISPGYIPGAGLLDHMVSVCLTLWETVKPSCRVAVQFWISVLSVWRSSCSASSSALGVVSGFYFLPSNGGVIVWIYISLIANDVKHLFMRWLALIRSSLVNCLFKFFAHFLSR